MQQRHGRSEPSTSGSEPESGSESEPTQQQ